MTRKLKKKNMLLGGEKKQEQQVLEGESREDPSQRLEKWFGHCRPPNSKQQAFSLRRISRLCLLVFHHTSLFLISRI